MILNLVYLLAYRFQEEKVYDELQKTLSEGEVDDSIYDKPSPAAGNVWKCVVIDGMKGVASQLRRLMSRILLYRSTSPTQLVSTCQ